MSFAVLLYIAVVYFLRRGENSRVVDAIAINWFLNQCVVEANGGFPVLPIFILVDFVTGLWLVTWKGGIVAHRASWFYIPMIAFNAAAYVNGEPLPGWHHATLFAFAWLQIGVVGAMDDGFRAFVDRASSGVLHPISSALYYFRGEK